MFKSYNYVDIMRKSKDTHLYVSLPFSLVKYIYIYGGYVVENQYRLRTQLNCK